MVEILIQRQNKQVRNIWHTEDGRSKLTLLGKKWRMKTFCPQDETQNDFFTLSLLSKLPLGNIPKEKHYKAITEVSGHRASCGTISDICYLSILPLQQGKEIVPRAFP